MFGDLMGNVQKQQEEIQKALKNIFVEGEAGGGAVRVTCNATKEVQKVSFDKSKLDWEDQEMVEDLLVVAINQAIVKAVQIEAVESQKAMKSMIPPGMESMFGM
jgi:nucleoid-associated protein EbfC